MFSDFPNLHPLVVHFPIVLILLSVVLQGILLFKDYYQIKWATLAVMGAAFLGSVFASYVFHAHIGELNPNATKVFERHEQFAFYTVWMSGITFLLQGIGLFYKLNQRSFGVIVFVAALTSAIFLSITGHQGAKLVYVEGVGPQGKNLMKGHSHSEGMEDSHDGMDMNSGDTTKGMENMDHHGNMQMDSGDATPGMDHSKMDMPAGNNSMKGMDHSKMNMPNNKANNTGMEGMDHSKMNTPNIKTTNKGMDHSRMNMPKNKTTSKGMEGMDHSKMDMPANKTDMPGMDHSKMNMPNSTTNKGVPAMDHSKMDMGSGMKGMGQMKYDYLIDPSKPYDNNPAREQTKPKQ